MAGLEFGQVMERETFEQYLSHLEDLTERIKRMEKRIEEAAQEPEYRERVQKLRAFRGIDYLTALALSQQLPLRLMLCRTAGHRRRSSSRNACEQYCAPRSE
jgi:transposase